MSGDANDLGALERALDPDGELAGSLSAVAAEHERQNLHAQAAQRRGELPPHEWLFVPLIRISSKDARALARGERRVWKVDVQDTELLRGGAVYCARCQIEFLKMSDVEVLGCAAPDEDPDAV